MSIKRKVAGSVLSVALLAAIVGMAVTFSAFTATTENTGNEFAAGTVLLEDNDAGAALLDLTDMVPGEPKSQCLTVTYKGSLDAKLRLYGTSPEITAGKDLAPFLDLTITRGTGAAADCSDFAADGDGAIYSGTLDALPADYAAGQQDPKVWSKDQSAVYRVTAEVQDDNDAQGKDTGASLVFEAHNEPTAP